MNDSGLLAQCQIYEYLLAEPMSVVCQIELLYNKHFQ